MSICLCCGGPCKDGATYAPGHSAKHAANLARAVAFDKSMTLEEAQAAVSTPKLQDTIARYVKSMSNPATRSQRQVVAKKQKHDLKERSSTEIANAKHQHEPTPVDDCGYELARGVWCARKYPCPIKEHN